MKTCHCPTPSLINGILKCNRCGGTVTPREPYLHVSESWEPKLTPGGHAVCWIPAGHKESVPAFSSHLRHDLGSAVKVGVESISGQTATVSIGVPGTPEIHQQVPIDWLTPCAGFGSISPAISPLTIGTHYGMTIPQSEMPTIHATYPSLRIYRSLIVFLDSIEGDFAIVTIPNCDIQVRVPSAWLHPLKEVFTKPSPAILALLATIRDEWTCVETWAIHAPRFEGMPTGPEYDQLLAELTAAESNLP